MELITVYVVVSEDLYFVKVSKDLNESIYNLFFGRQ